MGPPPAPSRNHESGLLTTLLAAGGHATLTEICQGTATNDGGKLIIEATVTDRVVENAGTTTATLAANAVIDSP